MNSQLAVETGLHWAAVVIYIFATLFNTAGLVFQKEKAERRGAIFVLAGLLVHSLAILYRWQASGHGPYMSRYEVMSADAWIIMATYLFCARIYARVRPVSLLVFPAVFLMIALGLFFNPEIAKLPPTFRSIWLVLHVTFYKISLATVLIALAFSMFYILKTRTRLEWLGRLPTLEVIDAYAYRFSGFSFIIWAIGMLAGSIWAYQSWGRFWGWDPIETWSLITWIAFGVHLHLRRFFRWQGERAAWFFIFCFLLSITALFLVSLVQTSVHSEYFR